MCSQDWGQLCDKTKLTHGIIREKLITTCLDSLSNNISPDGNILIQIIQMSFANFLQLVEYPTIALEASSKIHIYLFYNISFIFSKMLASFSCLPPTLWTVKMWKCYLQKHIRILSL